MSAIKFLKSARNNSKSKNSRYNSSYMTERAKLNSDINLTLLDIKKKSEPENKV